MIKDTSHVGKPNGSHSFFYEGIYISTFSTYNKMKDLIEKALDNQDIDMIVWLLRCDKQLLNHVLFDGSTCKERLIPMFSH